MVSDSSLCAPVTAIERMVCSTTGVAGAGGTGAAGAACARRGAAEPPRIVPTRSNVPARLLKLFDFEITRPRLFVQWLWQRATPLRRYSALPQPSYPIKRRSVTKGLATRDRSRL